MLTITVNGVRYVFQNFVFVVYIYNFASHISAHVTDTHQNYAERSVFLKTLIVSKRVNNVFDCGGIRSFVTAFEIADN